MPRELPRAVPEKGRVLGFGQHFHVSRRPKCVSEGNSFRAKLHPSGDQRAEPLKLLANSNCRFPGKPQAFRGWSFALVLLKQSQELPGKMPVRVLWLWPTKQCAGSSLHELLVNLKNFLE